MFRLRLATVAVAASLGLVSGCVCLPDFPLVARIRARLAGDCCGGGGVAADCEGPAMDAMPGNAAIMGGPGIHGFTFVLLIGILVGTYSSIAIAAPILLIGAHRAEAPVRKTPVGQLQRV